MPVRQTLVRCKKSPYLAWHCRRAYGHLGFCDLTPNWWNVYQHIFHPEMFRHGK